MTTRSVLIQRPISQTEAERISSLEATIYLRPGIPIPKTLSAKTTNYTLGADKRKSVGDAIFEQVLAFGDRELNDGKRIVDKLGIGRFNIWYYNKFRLVFQAREWAFDIAEAKELSKKTDELHWFCGEGRKEQLAEQNVRAYVSTPTKGKNYLAIFRFLSLFGCRALYGLFLKKPHNQPLVISPPERRQSQLNLYDGQPYKDDMFLAYLLEKYGKELMVLEELKIPTFSEKEDFKLLLAKHRGRKRIIGETVFLKGFINATSRREAKSMTVVILTRLKELKDVNTDPLGAFLLDRLMGYKSSIRYYALRFLAYRNYFNEVDIPSIACTDETSMYTKVILDAAKEQGIKTVGIQHGVVTATHPSYVFTEYDVAYHQPMPDKTLVWGEQSKRILIDHGKYKPENLAVVGQLRTDMIPRLVKHEKKANDFYVLFASQPQRDVNLRRQATLDIFAAGAALDISIHVKLHPRELDLDFFHECAREVGCTKYELHINDDLYVLLNRASLVITCFSTVGAEAVFFKKPLIILDHMAEDMIGYVAQGVASMATNRASLIDQIEGVREGSLQTDAQAIEKYIKKMANTIDGNVADRCWAHLS